MSRQINVMDLPITFKQLDRWLRGERIKKVMPHLSPWERNFLRTGMSEEEQHEYEEKK